MLQPHIIIYRHAVDVCCGGDAPGHLLCHMPRFMGQVPLLSGGDMNICSLCVCKCLHCGWLATVVVHPHAVHRITGEAFYTCFQVVWHTRKVRSGFTLYGKLALHCFVVIFLCPLYCSVKLALQGFFFVLILRALNGFECGWYRAVVF